MHVSTSSPQDGWRTKRWFPELNLPVREVTLDLFQALHSPSTPTRDTADRNNALAYFMREQGCFPNGPNNAGGGVDIKNILDFYFQVSIYFLTVKLLVVSQTCSLEMNCESMSVMAGTLVTPHLPPFFHPSSTLHPSSGPHPHHLPLQPPSPGQRRHLPHHRCEGARQRGGEECAEPNVQLRHVQLQRTVCFPGEHHRHLPMLSSGRAARQVRRLRNRHRCSSKRCRVRHLVPATGQHWWAGCH